MQLIDVRAFQVSTGYYFDDLAAIKAGAVQDGFFYIGEPLTPGHDRIRQPGEAIEIVLADGDIRGYGDAVSIQYSGVVGRDPVLRASAYLEDLRDRVFPKLKGAQIDGFRSGCELIRQVEAAVGHIHSGILYGLSQAVLDLVANRQKTSMAAIVANEYGEQLSLAPVPILAQSGDDRYVGVDKMILKQVDAIPQGLFNSIEKIGSHGERLEEYVAWISRRIREFGAASYRPTIHLDVYGTIGQICDVDTVAVADYLSKLESLAAPYVIRVEAPLDLEGRDPLIAAMSDLVKELRLRDSTVQIAADDWCNSLEDVKAFVDAGAADMIQIKLPDVGLLTDAIESLRYCKSNGVAAFLGGTCNGTDKSSQVTVNVAMAMQADLIYNKPGMGVDEGLMIVRNEMARIIDQHLDKEGGTGG